MMDFRHISRGKARLPPKLTLIPIGQVEAPMGSNSPVAKGDIGLVLRCVEIIEEIRTYIRQQLVEIVVAAQYKVVGQVVCYAYRSAMCLYLLVDQIGIGLKCVFIPRYRYGG